MSPVDLLVFGASGGIGRFLAQRLATDARRIGWVSRQASDRAGGWQADLHRDDPLPEADALISAGPLDAFADWMCRSGRQAGRVVAFSSTSAEVKSDSPDPAERDLAARLRSAEERLAEHCARRGAALTLLRPTLIYGWDGDRSLSRIVALARRRGFFLLPRGALGRRQPVHADDLAAAALAALAAPFAGVRRFDLPGGETLAYDAMVARLLDLIVPRPSLWRLPAPLFALALKLAAAGGEAIPGAALIARLRQDLVFDAAPARAALGYAPRAFVPEASSFAGSSPPSTSSSR